MNQHFAELQWKRFFFAHFTFFFFLSFISFVFVCQLSHLTLIILIVVSRWKNLKDDHRWKWKLKTIAACNKVMVEVCNSSAGVMLGGVRRGKWKKEIKSCDDHFRFFLIASSSSLSLNTVAFVRSVIDLIDLCKTFDRRHVIFLFSQLIFLAHALKFFLEYWWISC